MLFFSKTNIILIPQRCGLINKLAHKRFVSHGANVRNKHLIDSSFLVNAIKQKTDKFLKKHILDEQKYCKKRKRFVENEVMVIGEISKQHSLHESLNIPSTFVNTHTHTHTNPSETGSIILCKYVPNIGCIHGTTFSTHYTCSTQCPWHLLHYHIKSFMAIRIKNMKWRRAKKNR